MFKKVCIIGCGLIGSSIARAIRKQNLSAKIVSSNRSDSVNKKVIELKIVDDSNSDTKKMAEGSDLIIIAAPLSSYEDIILKIKDSLKNGSILTDVGSVKENVISLIEKNVPHTYIEKPGGHSWVYWVKSLDEHLRFFENAFNGSNIN